MDEIQKAIQARQLGIEQNIADTMQKGRVLPVGTIKKRGPNNFIKTVDGWKYHSRANSKSAVPKESKASKEESNFTAHDMAKEVLTQAEMRTAINTLRKPHTLELPKEQSTIDSVLQQAAEKKSGKSFANYTKEKFSTKNVSKTTPEKKKETQATFPIIKLGTTEYEVLSKKNGTYRVRKKGLKGAGSTPNTSQNEEIGRQLSQQEAKAESSKTKTETKTQSEWGKVSDEMLNKVMEKLVEQPKKSQADTDMIVAVGFEISKRHKASSKKAKTLSLKMSSLIGKERLQWKIGNSTSSQNSALTKDDIRKKVAGALNSFLYDRNFASNKTSHSKEYAKVFNEFRNKMMKSPDEVLSKFFKITKDEIGGDQVQFMMTHDTADEMRNEFFRKEKVSDALRKEYNEHMWSSAGEKVDPKRYKYEGKGPNKTVIKK